MKLTRDFYLREDVVAVSAELLGKVLCTRIGGELTKLIITGTAYVYLCYGIHHLFNIVTNKADIPHAILVRAGIPLSGTETMLRRRNKQQEDKTLLGGPGSLAQALGITTEHTGTSLVGRQIWIEDRGIEIDEDSIVVGPRVGVDYAGDDARRPYRFRADIR